MGAGSMISRVTRSSRTIWLRISSGSFRIGNASDSSRSYLVKPFTLLLVLARFAGFFMAIPFADTWDNYGLRDHRPQKSALLLLDLSPLWWFGAWHLWGQLCCILFASDGSLYVEKCLRLCRSGLNMNARSRALLESIQSCGPDRWVMSWKSWQRKLDATKDIFLLTSCATLTLRSSWSCHSVAEDFDFPCETVFRDLNTRMAL